MASNKNPNIPEVSDPDRPTKLSEQFSELYDSEWADAFDELGNSLGDKEDKEIISYLLDVVLIQFTSIAKLRDNNTTFADPCDPNRPTKLSEQFSELYDNEWADAFAELVKHLNGGDDKEIVSYLKDFVLEVTKITSEIFKIIKYGIKSMAPKLLERIRERVLERLEAKFSAEPVAGCLQSINVKRYIDKCTEVCCYMSVQDPQMVMDGNESPDWKFDSNKHREYTRKGPYEEFVVWPVLYLHREGQILSKGVAQGAKKEMSGQQ